MCQFCKEPIPKGELEVHIEESHAKIACSRCGVQVEKMHLEDHEVSWGRPLSTGTSPGPQIVRPFFMLNSTEHEIY